MLWTSDGVTFEAPLVVPPPDPENPYRVNWPLTAWSQARPSNRAVRPIPSVAEVDLDNRRESLPCYGMPLLSCGDDMLVWKASDGKVYATAGDTSPLFWDSPGVERGWIVDFTTFEEVHPTIPTSDLTTSTCSNSPSDTRSAARVRALRREPNDPPPMPRSP